MNNMNQYRLTAIVLVLVPLLAIAGCGSGQEHKDRDFTTSGSREADQRADQRMAQARQLEGSKDDKGTKATARGDEKSPEKKPLYDRLGGEQGVTQIVDDFVTRALADPRVNWERKGVKQGGFSLHRGKSLEWNASPENVTKLKQHLVQFIAVATGGPSKYDGAEMKNVHAGLHIANAEFDAAVGDLKASLDKFQVPNSEQRELLAIIESTRPQVVEQR
jgi:hemoglobin